MKVNILLHGGLGNQLFQFFAGLNIINKYPDAEIYLYTSVLNKYDSARKFELSEFVNSNKKLPVVQVSHDLTIARSRVFKILNKIRNDDFHYKLCNQIFLDGYFQNHSFLTQFDKSTLNESLSYLRGNRTYLGNGRAVIHIRMTDFIKKKTRKEVEIFVLSQLSQVASADIVTDDERYISEFLITNSINLNFRVVTTVGFTGYKTLLKIAEYSKIYTNGSTLAFWAAVIYSRELFTSNEDHIIFKNAII
jgi:hypothetical protein